MTDSFISLTGLIVNNPKICIKGNPNFACVCEPCMAEANARIESYFQGIPWGSPLSEVGKIAAGVSGSTDPKIPTPGANE